MRWMAPILVLGGKEISNLDELRATNDLKRLHMAAEYGRLLNWLKFHRYDDIAAEVESLSTGKDDPSFFENICNVLDIQFSQEYYALEKQMPSTISFSTFDETETEHVLTTDIANNELSRGLFQYSNDVLGLSKRACDTLISASIKSIGEMCQKNYKKVKKILPFKTLQEIENKLAEFGLSFDMSVKDISQIDFILMPEPNLIYYRFADWQVADWQIMDGDRFEKGQCLFCVSTSCFYRKINATDSGILRKKIILSGEICATGFPVAVIEIK